jgi:hypothetical protein
MTPRLLAKAQVTPVANNTDSLCRFSLHSLHPNYCSGSVTSVTTAASVLASRERYRMQLIPALGES